MKLQNVVLAAQNTTNYFKNKSIKPDQILRVGKGYEYVRLGNIGGIGGVIYSFSVSEILSEDWETCEEPTKKDNL